MGKNNYHLIDIDTFEVSEKLIRDEVLLAMYEKSFEKINIKNVKKGDKVEGYIVLETDKFVFVDFGYRQYGILTDNDKKYKKGEYLDFIVEKVEDDGNIYLSREKYITQNIQEKMLSEIEYNSQFTKSLPPEYIEGITFYKGIVKSIWRDSGFVVEVEGIDCFMPGSLSDVNKMFNFEELLGKEIMVAPVNYDRNNIVVSRKLYLWSLVPEVIDKLEINSKLYTGIVTGYNNYGVYVKFEELLTGMIYHTELSQDLDKFNNKILEEGGEISFYIKSVTNEGKIILSQKLDTTWDNLPFKVGEIVNCHYLKSNNKGILVQITENVRGLISHNKYTKNKTFKLNQALKAIVISIDKNSKKISLTSTL